jgi:hypothetical protein
MNKSNQACIDACVQCAQECEDCTSACLNESDVNEMAGCIRANIDCMGLCWTAAAFLSRESQFQEEICRLCAEACDVCAAECARHESEHCQRCSATCRWCADECRHVFGVSA